MLSGMSNQMTSFAYDIEQRLDKAYKVGGAGKKFGFDEIIETQSVDGSLTEEQKKMEKMANEAKSFLEKQNNYQLKKLKK